jgi:diguanylate cyclase
LRYTESKQQSGELLRQVLSLMGQHDAAFNPVSFTVWYEYAAGINSRLIHGLKVAMETEARLGDDTMLRLYTEHVAQVDHVAMQRISGEFQRMMSGMAESAERTGESAGAFGEQLNGLTTALQTSDPSALAPHLLAAVANTAHMKSAALALQQQVAAGRQEIERLQMDLTRARDEAMLDPLTRVMNRKGFDQQLAAMLAQAPDADNTHCLIMLDIDHFKKVNDTHGHVMGDRVIQALGEVLRASVPDKSHSVARYGGEEFAILLPNSTLDFSIKLADTVRTRTRAMKIRDRRTQEVVLTVSISGGVAAMKPGDEAHHFIARADGALYQSKHAGRDRVTCA